MTVADEIAAVRRLRANLTLDTTVRDVIDDLNVLMAAVVRYHAALVLNAGATGWPGAVARAALNPPREDHP